MASVTLAGIRKIYEAGAPTQPAVHDLDLEIADGEFMVLVGPSGCRKSTTLRMIAGLESISAGRLLIGGQQVNHVPAKDRDIAMVFQNYALYPHMTAYQNMAFALILRRLPKPEVDGRVREAARLLDIAARRRGAGTCERERCRAERPTRRAGAAG
jgi:multiple sugar transport system ATP-binding protein